MLKGRQVKTLEKVIRQLQAEWRTRIEKIETAFPSDYIPYPAQKKNMLKQRRTLDKRYALMNRKLQAELKRVKAVRRKRLLLLGFAVSAAVVIGSALYLFTS